MGVLDLIKEGKVKRFFRARNKIAYEDAVCHVTQRATGKEPLFLEEADYLYMLHLIKEKSGRFNFKVFSFALMPNHIHMLFKLGKENLARAMKNLFECYAMYFNTKYERKGHLFCGAYRSALCFDDSYLLAASLYIHLNPVRANIISNPAHYRWSSCGAYLKPLSKKTFLETRFILQLLDGDVARARQKYKGLLEDLKTWDMEDSLENPKALETFRNRLVEVFIRRFGTPGKEETKEGFLYDQELKEKIEELKKKKKLKSPEDIRARKFIIEQLISRGFGISDIKSRLGVSRASIYRTLHCNETK